MKKLIAEIRLLLKGSSGETIIEGLVSIMVFAIMMLSVSLLLSTALRISGQSIEQAQERQNLANQAILEHYSGTSQILQLRDSSAGIAVDINIRLSADGTFIAFAPEV